MPEPEGLAAVAAADVDIVFNGVTGFAGYPAVSLAAVRRRQGGSRSPTRNPS
jgi:hypothetical protein